MYRKIKSPDVRTKCCGILPLIAREPMAPIKIRGRQVAVLGYVIYCPRCGRRTEASNILPVAEMNWDCCETFRDEAYERPLQRQWYDTM